MTDNGLATTAHTLCNIHRAIINSHAKHNGMNKSEALRDIISDWAGMKRAYGDLLTACNMVFLYDEKVHNDVRAALHAAINGAEAQRAPQPVDDALALRAGSGGADD